MHITSRLSTHLNPQKQCKTANTVQAIPMQSHRTRQNSSEKQTTSHSSGVACRKHGGGLLSTKWTFLDNQVGPNSMPYYFTRTSLLRCNPVCCLCPLVCSTSTMQLTRSLCLSPLCFDSRYLSVYKAISSFNTHTHIHTHSLSLSSGSLWLYFWYMYRLLLGLEV